MSKLTTHFNPRVRADYVCSLITNQVMMQYHNIDISIMAKEVVGCFWNIDFDINDAMIAGDWTEIYHSQLLRDKLKDAFPTFWQDWINERFRHLPTFSWIKQMN